MSGINKILYTLAKFDPRLVEDEQQQVVDIVEHDKILSQLTSDGANKYNSILISLMRYVISYVDGDVKSIAKMHKQIESAFIGIALNEVVDDDKLFVTERVCTDNDEIYFTPVNVVSVDVRIIKVVLIQKMCVVEMSWSDMDIIKSAFNMKKYWSSVKIGGVDDSERIDYMKQYNHYLYEFYKRSSDPDTDVLECYKERSETNASVFVYGKKHYIKTIGYNLTLFGSIDHTNNSINEYCDNLKYYARRMYEVTYPEDYYKSMCGGGNSHYSVKFSKWNRCIRIYDLYKEYKYKGKPVNAPQIDAIGQKIVSEFELSTKYSVTDLRKIIKQDHATALELIESSTQGNLSNPTSL